jgi:phytoene dehydrogenase-like protein
MAVESADVVVVGGGLSGLATAAYLARAGFSVRLLERASGLGGRAATLRHQGYALNRGAHALYCRGEGLAVLKELGVPTPGRKVSGSGKALRAGTLHQLPVDMLSLLGTGLLGFGAKAVAARWLDRVPRLSASDLDSLSVTEWLARSGLPAEARALVEALVRLSTYANASDSFSAGTALAQLQRALGGVLYVDGGWQTLADGLRDRAAAAGAIVTTGARAESLRRAGSGAYTVGLSDGSELTAPNVVLAIGPRDAAALIASSGASVPEGLSGAQPLRAATLDVALSHLPKSHEPFILGIDRPLYLSLHSRAAKLAPEGGAVVQAMKYLAAGDDDPDADRAELETLMDLGMPGWRASTVHVQFLPRMITAERLDLAAEGGAAGRPSAEVHGLPGVLLAGDWVRGNSWLADASLGSGRAAARLVVARSSPRRAVA